MGFSLSKVLGSVAKFAPVVGAVFPSTRTVTSALSTLSAPFVPPPAPAPTFMPTNGSPWLPTITIGGPQGAGMAANGGGATPAMGAVGGAVVAAGGIIARVLRAASAAVGRRVTRSALVTAIKRFGPGAISVALGIAASDLVEFFIATGGKERVRRARGITGPQLRTTTATLRRLDSVNDRVRKFCRPYAPRARRVASKGKR
jgi:hypothetical protein